ncbi:dipeptidyl peptidase 3 [Hetaerina americana]|uniref:dipeptidyl peptidase 3 n=1 Tax=Hetaerina americana TaxID=62018 RepID=UPI003A7F49C2
MKTVNKLICFACGNLRTRLSAPLAKRRFVSYSKSSVNTSTIMVHKSPYILPNEHPVVALGCTTAFNGLTSAEKKYAHFLSRAAWHGGLIALVQTSPESPLIYSLLHRAFSSQSLGKLKKIAIEDAKLTEDEYRAILVYTSGIFTNSGNYKGFGDTKFIPGLPKEKFEAFIFKIDECCDGSNGIRRAWNKVSEAMYSLKDNEKSLGFAGKGITTYFSGNCTMDDAQIVNEFMKFKSLSAYNTRACKSVKDGVAHYQVRLASVSVTDQPVTEEFKGAVFSIVHGDYSPILKVVNKELCEAKEYAANSNEKEMLDYYAKSFQCGNVSDHIEGSRYWIKDKGPVIETYIGFIETYRDPAGVRGEFEGFVAMVNKEMSAKFGELVEKAENFLPRLPWPKSFEKDRFLRPDFTSLDVLTFSGSMIPSGINIPNYDEIRQSEGFKNVSLGNVIPAHYKESKIPFLSESDQAIMTKYRVNSFEVQVGLHELLGHGSGKNFRRDENGKFNFDADSLVDPLTNEKVKSWYEPGETYDTKFTDIGSSCEECRAECVGLYLSLEKDILKIFGFEGDEAEDVIYVNWLSLIWTGMGKALEMYQPETQKWMQAHSQARFVILKVLIEAGEDFIKIKETENGNNLLLTVDRSKLRTVGKEAIGKLLLMLQVYHSTGDAVAMRAMYNKYSEVTDEGPYPWAKWRDIIMAHKQPRKMFVQANTFIKGDEIELRNYDSTHEGLIQSWVERFPDTSIDDVLEAIYDKDIVYYK